MSIEKLNQQIIKTPGTVWVWGLLTFGILGAILMAMSPYILGLDILVALLAILFWLSNPYICYIAARGLNRNAVGWAIFGCLFMPLPIIIIAHLVDKGPLPEGPYDYLRL